MRHLLLSASLTLAATFTPNTASAQCPGPNSATFSPYGATCAFFGQDSFLSGAYDATTCTMTLTHTSSLVCCNTFLVTNVILIGAQPITPGLPIPGFLVPGCEVAVVPFSDFQSTPAQTLVEFPVPASAIGLTLYFQGVNVYFTTIGFTNDFQTSNGLSATFS